LNDTIKNLLVWGAILFVLMSAFRNLTPQQQASALDYSAFIQEVQQQRVASVVIDGQKIERQACGRHGFSNRAPQCAGYTPDGRLAQQQCQSRRA
jgi:cell division protease FtsH